MSLLHMCDFPGCGKEADVRITEHRYDDPSFEQSLDACEAHRTVTHAGWWCSDADDVLAAPKCNCPTMQDYHDPFCPFLIATKTVDAVRDRLIDVPDFGLQEAYKRQLPSPSKRKKVRA